MSRQIQMAAQFPPVVMLAPQADAAGRTSSYASFRNAGKAWITALVNQGNAATVTLTLLQATSAAGAGAKVISNPVPIWLDDATTSSDALVAQSPATAFTTDANLSD